MSERDDYGDPDPAPRWMHSVTVGFIIAALLFLSTLAAGWAVCLAYAPDMPRD
jgi:hypothetical protein